MTCVKSFEYKIRWYHVIHVLWGVDFFIGGDFLEDIIFKDMFIILNNENKVLTFFANDENQIKMFLPYLIDSNKLIGIISHVTELKERIDKKIYVKKTMTSSEIVCTQ